MIVTKEIAEKYILKRGCYLIHLQPDGDYTISHERLNWKEGMELFETQKECEAEVEKRLKLRKKPGDCPRCYNKATREAEVDVSALELLPGKFAPFYRCSKCQTVWHNMRGSDQLTAFDKAIADYVLDWNARDLKPSQELKKILKVNVSFDKKEEVYLQSVKLKNGEEHPCAVILLKTLPPDRLWFERKDLFFLDQVTETKASPYAYPPAIARKAWNERNYIHIRDVTTKENFIFDSFVTMFMPKDHLGREFTLGDESARDTRTIVQRDERGGEPWWSLTPPPAPIYVWGDKG